MSTSFPPEEIIVTTYPRHTQASGRRVVQRQFHYPPHRVEEFRQAIATVGLRV